MPMTPQDLAGVLAEMKKRHAELETALADPNVYSDRFRFRTLNRERGQLESFFRLYETWTRSLTELEANGRMLQTERDEALRQLIEADMVELTAAVAAAEKQLGTMLLPPDPNDARNTIVEIRPAAGGEEAERIVSGMIRTGIPQP